MDRHQTCTLHIIKAEHRDLASGRWVIMIIMNDGTDYLLITQSVLVDPLRMDDPDYLSCQNGLIAFSKAVDVPVDDIIRRPDLLAGKKVHALLHLHSWRGVSRWGVVRFYDRSKLGWTLR
jgi:hypothetical protein